MKVYIIGYMGTGKTTGGKRLSRLLDLPFLDADALVENIAAASVSEIFAKSGEERFRALEQEVLAAFAENEESAVLSAGGGMPMHFDNMNRMLESGVVVWFDLAPGMIAARLEKSADTRPLIKGLSGTELRSAVETQLAVRIPVYARAHIRADSTDLSAARLKKLAEEIRTYSR